MPRTTPWWRAPWTVGCAFMATVLLTVAAVQGVAAGGDPAAPLDLTAAAPLTRLEWWVLLGVCLVRLAFLRMSARPEPLADLLLLSFVLSVTGGGASWLHPALPMAYLAALLYVRGDEVKRRSRWDLFAHVLVGLLLMHQFVTLHDELRLREAAGAHGRSEALATQERLHWRNIWRRGAVDLGLAGFVLLALHMRDRWRRDVLAAEEERGRRLLELEEQEKNNWIALTAGLTHGLGNDILAYDIYLDEVRRALQHGDGPAPPAILERVRFLHESNKGRLAFLQFLEAFARQRKAIDSGALETLPRVRLALEPLIERVRRHLAAVETADLPPAGSDPAVDAQLHRLRDLPVQVTVADEHAATLYHGHKGVVEFVAYELLKNALRNATGARPVTVTLSTHDGGTRVRMVNDVRVLESSGACPGCGAGPVPLRTLARRRDHGAACADCFREHLRRVLHASFEPGEGGGTGLGLFLIRYFLSSYYGGQIRAQVEDAAVPSVCFELWIPNRVPTDGEPEP